MKAERAGTYPETVELVEIGGSAESRHSPLFSVRVSNETLNRNGCINSPRAEAQEMGPLASTTTVFLSVHGLGWKYQGAGLQEIFFFFV